MATLITFVCDVCGATAQGEPGMYVHPDPPLGWVWRFGPGLEGPHACSQRCWDIVQARQLQSDGRILLSMTHEPDVMPMPRVRIRETPRPAPPPPPPPRKPPKLPQAVQHVYIAQRGDSGPVKIGISKNVCARLKQLQTGTPEPIRLLAKAPGSRTDESELHARFHASRLTGEWFTPTPDLLTYAAAVAARSSL